MHFFLFYCEKKRKKRTQRKRKHANILRPTGVLIEWLLRASPHSLASQSRCYAPQTMFGISFVRLTERIINVQERTTKQVLFECRRHEFTCLARLLQLINECSYSARGFLWHFFAGTKKCRIKLKNLFQ